MLRRVCCLAVAGVLLSQTAAWAGPKKATSTTSTPATTSRSTGKRVAWTVIGAGAGFAAGVFLGLHQFDDAINSDRKVWTAAILGAVGGGVAGALLSRNIGRAPATAAPGGEKPRASVVIPWSSAVSQKPNGGPVAE